MMLGLLIFGALMMHDYSLPDLDCEDLSSTWE